VTSVQENILVQKVMLQIIDFCGSCSSLSLSHKYWKMSE